MAEIATVAVQVESVIHDVLLDAIQQISSRHGIQVQSISVEWTDCSTVDKQKFTASRIGIDSFSVLGRQDDAA